MYFYSDLDVNIRIFDSIYFRLMKILNETVKSSNTFKFWGEK